MTFQRPILWIHVEALGANNPALQAWPEAPAVFVFDTCWIQDARISRKRLGFLYENALDLPLTLRRGMWPLRCWNLPVAIRPMVWSAAARWIHA